MPRKNPVPQSEKAIGARVRKFRRENHIEQVAFARALEIDGRLLGAYENGRIPLPYYVGRRICEKFSLSPEWLAGGRHLQKAHYARDVMEHPDIPARMLFSEAYEKFVEPRLPDDLDSVLKDSLLQIGVPADDYVKSLETSKSHGTAARRVFEAFVKDHVLTASESNQSIFFSEMTDFLAKFMKWLKEDEERERTKRPITLVEADPEGFFDEFKK